MKLFQREPTLYIAALNALIMVVGTLGLHAFSGQQAALLVVLVNAILGVANAWTTRPISPAVFTYAIAALLSFLASYGYNVPTETIAGINAAVVPILALIFRGQVSPEVTPVTEA